MNKIIEIEDQYLVGMDKIVDLVGSTAGPYGANVHLFDGTAPVAFRDGMKVLEHYQPVQDDMANNLVTRVRQRAAVVRRAAGDATTTFTILLGAFYRWGLNAMAGSHRGMGSRIRWVAARMLDALDAMAIKVTNDAYGYDLLAKVATLAGNNDPVIGEMVAKLVFDIGVDGTVEVEFDDSVSALSARRLEGFLLKGGPWHESFIGGKFGKSSIENPYVLIIDEAKDWKDVAPMMQAWVMEFEKDGRPLVVVSLNLEGSALGTLVKRVRAGGGPVLPVYCVRAEDAAVLSDLRAVVGGKNLVKRDGAMLADFKGVGDFGEAAKVIVDMKGSVFIGKEGVGDLAAHKDVIRVMLDGADNEEKRAKLKGRLANMEQRIGIIKVPIITTGATNWLKEVVEDAYMASFAALKEGVLPGAGLSIARAGMSLGEGEHDELSGLDDVSFAVFRRLLENGGVDSGVIEDCCGIVAQNEGELSSVLLDERMLKVLAEDGDSSQFELCDAIEIGVLDSLSAIKAAVYNAAEEAAEWIETRKVVLPNS